MKNTLKFAVCAAAVALTASLHATSISGSVGFGGTYVQVGGTAGLLGSATSMTINAPVAILSATGDLSGATTPSFIGSIGVNGNAPALVGAQLWSVIVGGKTFTFTVVSETETVPFSNQLNIVGTGTLDDGAGGFDATLGNFQLGFGANGDSFTWQSTANSVPDGGATAMLIGVGLSGLALVRRKLN
jgi:hypothetical protein